MTRTALPLSIAAALLAALGGCAAPPPLTHGTPADVGMDPQALEAAVDLYRDAVEADDIRNVELLVARRGRVILHEALGWRDNEGAVPMQTGTLFRMASNTKAVVCAAALILEEEGRLSMDDPVSRWIPEFAEGSLAGITIHHLATHTSGLPRGPIFLPGMADDTTLAREAARFAAELELQSTPGERYAYSNVGYNVLGAVIESASGQRLDVFLRERIYLPLGMHDSCNHESAADHNRMARVYRRGEDRWRARWSPGDDPDYPIPRASGGMISSAWDFAIFTQTFLNGGRSGRTRILSEDAANRATSPLVSTGSGGYGYGWSVREDGAFSHGGSDGTHAWADPHNDLIILVLTQSPGGRNPRSEFIRAVTDAVLDRQPAAVAN